MIRMRAPEGLTGFTHQGYQVEISDGIAHVDPRFRGDFEAHGFRADDEASAAPPATIDLRRRALIDAYARHLDTLPDAEIDGMLEEMRRAAAPAGASTAEDDEGDGEDLPGGFDPLAVTVADLPGLKRPQLFAVLKARSIPAVPPISNDTLREKARTALAG
ncbi:hypothetical protein ACQVP2_22340 [Methylobacterium aquaticum]|uniref:hypothetical protein n=1 Tax=Methylobacterium aquaticum TaxID=270351 RepID=UPI003D17AFD0